MKLDVGTLSEKHEKEDFMIFHMTKKWIGVLIFFFLVGFLCAGNGNAHPPKNMIIQYDPDVQMLSVTINHPVQNSSKHYMEEVSIKKNGQIIGTYPYTSQPVKSPFIYTYKVSAKSGDVLKVRAKCSILGSKTGTLRIF